MHVSIHVLCSCYDTTYVMQEILQGFIIKILTTTTHAHVLSFFLLCRHSIPTSSSTICRPTQRRKNLTGRMHIIAVLAGDEKKDARRKKIGTLDLSREPRKKNAATGKGHKSRASTERSSAHIQRNSSENLWKNKKIFLPNLT